MTPGTVRRTVRASALYDLLLTAPFATPWTAPHAFAAVGALSRALGLDGLVPTTADPYTLLFANLLGSIVTVWSVVRLLRPTRFLAAADSASRFLFALGFGWALTLGATPVVAGFLLLEVCFGLLQAYAAGGPVLRARLARRRTLAAC